MRQYTYSKLDLNQHSFRLVTLKSGKDPLIRCTLFDAVFDEGHETVSYEALSYTWGESRGLHRIEVNTFSSISVTDNLFGALQHLRYPLQDRVLWIDAICIDQSNVSERGHQVQQMGSIYERAEMVLIWLGHPTFETHLLFSHTRLLQEAVLKQSFKGWSVTDKRWMRIWTSFQPQPTLEYVDLTRLQQDGFKMLLGRPWFQRVWVIQEVAKARAARIICGTQSVSTCIFALLPALLGVNPSRHYQSILDVMPSPWRKNTWWIEKRDLYTLIVKFHGCKATDPKDMIYALLGISSDATRDPNLKIDYSKSTKSLISDVNKMLFGKPRKGSAMEMTEYLSYIACVSTAQFCKIVEIESAPLITQILLQQRIEVQVTDNVVEAAAKNRKDGLAVLKILLQQRPEDFIVTEKVLQAVACNEMCGHIIMNFLLERSPENVVISEELPTAIARNHAPGASLSKLLPDQRPQDVEITQTIVEAALTNLVSGPEVLEAIFQYRPHAVKMTEDIREILRKSKFEKNQSAQVALNAKLLDVAKPRKLKAKKKRKQKPEQKQTHTALKPPSQASR